MTSTARKASVTALTEAIEIHDSAAFAFMKAAEKHARKALRLNAQLEQLKQKPQRREVSAA